jgi:hypothetical protein
MTVYGINSVAGAHNAACDVCALSASSGTLGQEGLYYTPSLFVAAIIGENPTDFGLAAAPLSAAQR